MRNQKVLNVLKGHDLTKVDLQASKPSMSLSDKQVKAIEQLWLEIGTPDEEKRNYRVYSPEMASQYISQLQAQKKKLEVYYAKQLDMEHLSQMGRYPVLLKAIKTELLIPSTTLLEKRDVTANQLETLLNIKNIGSLEDEKQDLEILIDRWLDKQMTTRQQQELDKLEAKLDKVTNQLVMLNKVASRGDVQKHIDNLENRLRKIDRLIEEVKSFNVTNYADVKNIRLEKDVVTSFIRVYEQEYQAWLKTRATQKQVDFLLELVRRCDGTDKNTDWIYCLSKEEASDMIDKLRVEQTYNYRYGDSTIARTYRGYEFAKNEEPMKDEYSHDSKTWCDMLHELSGVLGYRVDTRVCDYNDFETLKELIKLALDTDRLLTPLMLSEQLQEKHWFTKTELEAIGLNFTPQQIFDYEHNKQSKLNDIKNMLELGLISKDELLKAIQ